MRGCSRPASIRHLPSAAKARSAPDWPRWSGDGHGSTQLLDVPVRKAQDLMGPQMRYHHDRYRKLLQAGTPE